MAPGLDRELDHPRLHLLALADVERDERVGRVLGADGKGDEAGVARQAQDPALVEVVPLEGGEHLRVPHIGVDDHPYRVPRAVAVAVGERLERRVAVRVRAHPRVVHPHRGLVGDVVPLGVLGAAAHDQGARARGGGREANQGETQRVGGDGHRGERPGGARVAALERVPCLLVELDRDGGRDRPAGVVARRDLDRDRLADHRHVAHRADRDREHPAAHHGRAAPAHHAARGIDHLDLERQPAVVGDALGRERHLGPAVQVGARLAGLEHAAVTRLGRSLVVLLLPRGGLAGEARLEQVVAHRGPEHRGAEEVARRDPEAHLVAVDVDLAVGRHLDAEFRLAILLDCEGCVGRSASRHGPQRSRSASRSLHYRSCAPRTINRE